MTDSKPPYFAAIDLGSNSFHMIIARATTDSIEVIDRVKEMVQLARGTVNNEIAQDAQERALACLSRFSERLENIPIHKVRVVATKSLRTAQNTESFIKKAELALGYPISIISGYEEARLVYKGLSHCINNDSNQRLVIDIGGGSTEFIIGHKTEPELLESLNLGCLVFAEKFQLQSNVTKAKIQRAYYSARTIIAQIRTTYCTHGWDIAYGTSGTMKAIGALVSDSDGGAVITEKSLTALIDNIINDSDATLKSLPQLRKDVIPAGAVILSAIFHEFNIDSIRVADATLKDGLIFDTLGRLQNRDARYTAIDLLQHQYRVDLEQAARVTQSCIAFWIAIKTPVLPGLSRTKILTWGAKVHEIGLAISHSGHHNHSYYILRHSDLAGFGRYEQYILASLVRAHRNKLNSNRLSGLDETAKKALLPMILCLRLAVILHRRRENLTFLPILKCKNDEYTLKFPDGWLEQHPLTRAGLEQETHHLSNIGIHLKVEQN